MKKIGCLFKIMRSKMIPSSRLLFFSNKKNQKFPQKETIGKESQTVQTPKEINLADYENKCNQLILDFDKESQMVKVGKLDPNYIGKIRVRTEDGFFELRELSQITPINAYTIALKLFDDSLKIMVFKSLEKEKINELSFQMSDDKILVSLPNANTKERKMKILKYLKEIFENQKNKIRDERTAQKKSIEKYKKSLEKDLISNAENEIQDIHDKAIELLSEIVKKREKEIMS